MQGAAMLENDTKREGQLLGKLNRERARAPRGVIANEAWVADGETIRALGAPMGNNFDETAWWKGRYRAVKARIATWPGMRRLSIRGRNLLLQSIFYGSFRYWLYFLIMPDPIIKKHRASPYHDIRYSRCLRGAVCRLWCVESENVFGGLHVCERSVGRCLSIVEAALTPLGGGTIVHSLIRPAHQAPYSIIVTLQLWHQTVQEDTESNGYRGTGPGERVSSVNDRSSHHRVVSGQRHNGATLVALGVPC